MEQRQSGLWVAEEARTLLTPLVDSVQALNVLVALVLEGGPVDLGSVVRDLIAVSVGLVQLLPVKPQTENRQPSRSRKEEVRTASAETYARSAACHMTFFGTQPTLTQVPPSLQVSSMIATCRAPEMSAMVPLPRPRPKHPFLIPFARPVETTMGKRSGATDVGGRDNSSPWRRTGPPDEQSRVHHFLLR